MEAEPAPPAAQPPSGGRPTSYTPELGERICDRLLEGESLSAICKAEALSRGQVLRWLAAEPEFRLRYRQARMLAAELIADELLGIVDDATQDWVVDGKGEMRLDKEAVMRSRLRFDGRRWLLSKLLPRTYGEKAVEDPATGALLPPGADQPGQVVQHEHTHRLLLTPDQRAAVARALAEKFKLLEGDNAAEA